MSGWDRLLAPLLRARRFDEMLVDKASLLTGVFHVSIGMESTAAALACLRSRDDVVMLSHRNHGHLVALGSAPDQLYRELLGRDNGGARGRGGSVHLADPRVGVPYTSAMLGGGAAVGVGIALAKRRQCAPGLVWAFFGDGAMGEGLVYESLDLAALWQLPIVFICESNVTDRSGGGLARVAEAHGVPATFHDGSDPRVVLQGLHGAAGAVRDGSGPRFVEAASSPWPGNSTFLPHSSDRLDMKLLREPATGGFAAVDPVACEARALLRDGIGLPALLELDAAVSAEIVLAFAEAEAAPPPPARSATDDVWAPA